MKTFFECQTKLDLIILWNVWRACLFFVLRISLMLMHTSAKWNACLMSMAMYGFLCFGDFIIPIWFFSWSFGVRLAFVSRMQPIIGAIANVMYVDAHADGDLMQNRWFLFFCFSLFIPQTKVRLGHFWFSFRLWFYSLLVMWWMKKKCMICFDECLWIILS